MSIAVKKTTIDDVHAIVPLFNAYRMFYGQHSNLPGAETFIRQRIENNESVIFIALDGDKAVGFAQLYPIFTSVGLKSAWLLNDLFVAEQSRHKGAATALLNAAKEHGAQTKSGWLMLQTAVNNVAAQKVYESNGWVRDNEYYVYTFKVAE